MSRRGFRPALKRADVRSFRAWKGSLGDSYSTNPEGILMNSIIYIVGLVVIIAFVLGYFGLR